MTTTPKRVALCRVANGVLTPIEEFDEATDARKRVKQAKTGDLEPGEYAIVAYLNKGITVAPPPPTERLVVDLGQTFITKAPKATEPDQAGQPAPERKSKGLFGRGSD